jgi:hypothetical protein
VLYRKYEENGRQGNGEYGNETASQLREAIVRGLTPRANSPLTFHLGPFVCGKFGQLVRQNPSAEETGPTFTALEHVLVL